MSVVYPSSVQTTSDTIRIADCFHFVNIKEPAEFVKVLVQNFQHTNDHERRSCRTNARKSDNVAEQHRDIRIRLGFDRWSWEIILAISNRDDRDGRIKFPYPTTNSQQSRLEISNATDWHSSFVPSLRPRFPLQWNFSIYPYVCEDHPERVLAHRPVSLLWLRHAMECPIWKGRYKWVRLAHPEMVIQWREGSSIRGKIPSGLWFPNPATTKKKTML